MPKCPCGSDLELAKCCEPFLTGKAVPETAEQTMRARYTAYTRADIPFLLDTVHPSKRESTDEASARRWATGSEWLGLQIVSTDEGGPKDKEGLVEFIARFRDRKGELHTHHEVSKFLKEDGRWYFFDGHAPQPEQAIRTSPKVGRNDPCPCGSGKKYKKCCEKG